MDFSALQNCTLNCLNFVQYFVASVFPDCTAKCKLLFFKFFLALPACTLVQPCSFAGTGRADDLEGQAMMSWVTLPSSYSFQVAFQLQTGL